MLQSAFLFLVTGLAEIGGGYMVWLWLKEGKGWWYGLIGAIILFVYGIVPTLQQIPHVNFGRLYAAYGGMFIILALIWGVVVDKQTFDLYDWLGASIALIGGAIIIWAPRS